VSGRGEAAAIRRERKRQAEEDARLTELLAKRGYRLAPRDDPRGSGGSCRVLRRFIVTHGTMNLATGETEFSGGQTVEEAACGSFPRSDETGMCRSCERGWETEGNRPIRIDGWSE
jgi:hypothetical protein